MKPSMKIFLIGMAAALTGRTAFQRIRSVRRWLAARTQSGPGTALITGASAGIGAEFARRLARDGYNLVLVARRPDRLQAVADDIQAEAARRGRSINIEILPADLNSEDGIARVANRLQSIPNLELLVNNAGFGTGGRFATIDLQPELSMVQVHILATMRLTRAALPVLVARGYGGIINVSSMAAFLPSPGSVTYGASKSFMNSFTEGLYGELRGSGVRLQVLCPGYTYSEFHDRIGFNRARIPAFLWLPAGLVVEESLQGLREGRLIVVPGTLYKLLYALIKGIPFGLASRAAALVRFWMRKR
jgi:uncharacterized protein